MLESIQKANSTFPPLKCVLYGVGGIGKTSFGATFEKPILLPVEDGGSNIDIDAFPRVTTLEDVVSAINALHGDHSYKTLIVDSLDWLEPLIWAATCAEHSKASIEAFGYGKGYIEADKSWRFVMGGFDSLRANKGMNIVCIAHSVVIKTEPPDADQYDRYTMKLHKRAGGLWHEWADLVAFIAYKINVIATKTEKTRGIGTGDRVIHTVERPAWDAKNRWSLPDEILIGKDKTWSAFHAALAEATNNRYVNPTKKEETK
jgi:hypothetical protein